MAESKTSPVPPDTNKTSKIKEMVTMEDAIHTEVSYLIKDPQHEVEKPYDARFDTHGAIPNTNMENETKSIMVHDFRSIQNSQSFEEYGFTSTKLDCALTSAEFYDDSRVKEIYYPAIERLLWQKFPEASEIKILEHVLRKRHPQFPAVAKETVEHFQPATKVHIDYSLYSATQTAIGAFKATPDTYRRLLTVNFWKSIQGPGNDWPLALCDSRTIDFASETIATDVVFYNRYTENQSVYYSPKQKWYYLKDLRDDEAIMLRNTDSDLEGGGGAAHSSFENPLADENAAPRESIELRAFLIFV